MFALADCDNFFASCERVFRPDLQGKPVIVLSSNDGCAIARSNEAKALGIKMGDPFFKIKHLVEKHGVAVFSGNMALYGDMSQRVRWVLEEYAPAVEVYSIDEAFLDLRGINNIDFDKYAKEISAQCWKMTSIPVSVGIAPTKTLAKIASKLCKQYPKLRGGCYMHRPQDIEKVLRKFPIEDVWGIGRRSSAKLQARYIKTAYDFTQLPEAAIQKMMGITGVRTWKELQGIPCIEFEDGFEAKQSICVSRSFSSEIYDL
ncbi:MAG: Y-family DNA polymerase, partial [Bacteroidales bacterium]|nr:Y-family DNA polymerase [Bacteroidales bacterium]